MGQIDKLEELLKGAPILNVIPERELAKQLFDRGVRVLSADVCGERLTQGGEGEAFYPHCFENGGCRERDHGGCEDCGFIDVTVCRKLAAFEDMVYDEKREEESGS